METVWGDESPPTHSHLGPHLSDVGGGGGAVHNITFKLSMR
jgi:hypothetical protein